jgi:hypothetical protein
MRQDRAHALPHLRTDWAHPCPHLHRDWAHALPHLHSHPCQPCHICSATGLMPCQICTATRPSPATSAVGLGLIPATSVLGQSSILPHLHRDGAHPSHICTGTGLVLCHICAWTWPSPPPTSASGLGSRLATSDQDWAPTLPHMHRSGLPSCRICAGLGLTPPTSAPGLGSPRPHLRRDWAHPRPKLRGDWAHPSQICAGTRCSLAEAAERAAAEAEVVASGLGSHDAPMLRHIYGERKG